MQGKVAAHADEENGLPKNGQEDDFLTCCNADIIVLNNIFVGKSMG